MQVAATADAVPPPANMESTLGSPPLQEVGVLRGSRAAKEVGVLRALLPPLQEAGDLRSSRAAKLLYAYWSPLPRGCNPQILNPKP